MDMQEGGQPRSGVVEMPASRSKDTVENAEATWQSTVTVEHGCDATLESLLENETAGYGLRRVVERIRLLGR
jgi:hypothetical protein